MFDHLPRALLATLPTPLEVAPRRGDAGPRMWIKRDDLTGLGGGGNKARKLEFLCGQAIADGAKSLVTVGASQSNHCRMTAAAGSRLGLDVHLIVSGHPPTADNKATGNQLLSTMFGAQMHYTGAADSHWGELEVEREILTDDLTSQGLQPLSIPVGGSTAVGALGYALGFIELIEQCAAAGFVPRAVVVTSSSGGTHAGLLAGRAALLAAGALHRDTAPDIIAIGVAKGVNLGYPAPTALADEALALMGVAATVDADDVIVDPRWMGEDYGAPTDAGSAAIDWAARRGGWLMDPTYSGKGFSGLLGRIDEGCWTAADDVVFIHTGGWPALFA